MKSIAKILLGTTTLSGALTSLLISAAPALSDEIETVVVTARQRSEDIEKVPGQVSAFTAGQIEAKGIKNPADFLNAVPNVSFISTQNAGTSFIVMRGIGQARNSEPSAAIVVDGVPLTQPAAFNQDLFDIQQIEVVKGPQGALYGRNAIGGAILINTKQPGDTWEERLTAGYDDGPGYKVQGTVGGPLADTLKVRAAVSYWNTDGWLTNVDTKDQSARRNADPVEDFNARLSFLYTPTEDFTADLRLSTDLLNTRGLYYTVSFLPGQFNNPNFVDQPINENNSGMDDRKIYDAALKLSYNTNGGTLSSITGYSTVWEILTGDGYSFDPFGQSKIGFDFGQAQFLTARTFSQEVRYTSTATEHFRWIAGGEIFYTQRYISTGNMYDGSFDSGVQPVYRDPNPQFGITSFDPQSQISYLADGQNQFAWAGYLDMSYDLTDTVELSANMRYDSDHRENTTLTPQEFLDANPVTLRQAIPAHTGDKRSHTWDAFQPQAIVRWQATDNLNLYADYSRGFRSGGFNQTGVAQAAAAAGFDNVGDLFDANTADTIEAGFKSQWDDGRFTLNGSAYYTWDHNDYYFVFLASNSTQNLGNIKEAELAGFDLDATAHVTDYLALNAGFGYTHSEITEFPGPTSALVVGSKLPLVSELTFNIGAQLDLPIGEGWMFHGRIDDNVMGDTTFVIPVLSEPTPIARKPVNLLDLRLGIEHDNWVLTAWSKNLLDEKYNSEYSTGGFRFKGQPVSYGVELTKRF
ncbi:MAG TPA: TonB-dependent receptor [Rhizomicrobium sp.]|nr:TonB-dependent receptor [Rhizomicrobium sp.]